MEDHTKVVKSENKISNYFPQSPKPKENSTDVTEIVEGGLTSVLLTPDSTPTKCSETGKVVVVCSKEDLSLPQDTSVKDHESPKSLQNKRNENRNTPEPSDPKICKSENSTDSAVKSEESPQVKPKKGRRKGKKSSKSATATSTTSSQPKPKALRKKPEQRNSLLTDYFPIRRSSRVPSSELKKQTQRDLEEAILSGRKDGLKVEDFGEKGRGVVSTKPFKKGDFVVEYKGDLISLEAAKLREKNYVGRTDVGCYMYYFNFQNKSYCVDATAESGKLGRLLNHSKTKPNCCTKVVGIGDKPYLILVAAKNIDIGEELVYDYGDRNKETLEANPWLAF